MHNHHTEGFALLCTNYSAYLMGTTVINIIGEGLAWVQGYSMHMCTCTDPRQGRTQTIAHLSGLNACIICGLNACIICGLNACIICAGCCSTQCNCAEGLHFSAFQFYFLFVSKGRQLPIVNFMNACQLYTLCQPIYSFRLPQCQLMPYDKHQL